MKELINEYRRLKTEARQLLVAGNIKNYLQKIIELQQIKRDINFMQLFN